MKTKIGGKLHPFFITQIRKGECKMKIYKKMKNKMSIAITFAFVSIVLPIVSFADKNAPDLKDVNKDVNSLLAAPSWFKVAFYTIAGLIAFAAGAIGVLKWLQANTDQESLEAKKKLGKILALTIGIPIILRIIIAFIQWRFDVNLNF